MQKFILLLLVCSLSSCSYINKKVGLKDDNAIEEGIEAVIENQTGIKGIDLTPSTPENK